MNKESKDVKYFKLDWRNKLKIGLMVLLLVQQIMHYPSVAHSFANMVKKKEVGKWTTEVSFDGYLPPNDDNQMVICLSLKINSCQL